jgi:hypothetical protein
MSRTKQKEQRNLLHIVEEATHLLRQSPTIAWVYYYLGTAPFVSYLFFFWSDMSRSAMAESRLMESSLILAVLYGWMKVWQALYCERLMAIIEGKEELAPMKLRGWLRLISSQTWIHASMPWVLTLASIAVLPMAWVYAFYHNITVFAAEHYRDGGRTRALYDKALSQSHYLPLQNHGLLLLLSLIAPLVYFNVFSGFATLCFLMKAFTGMENEFTRQPSLFMTSSFQMMIIGVCYLIMGPLVKALYVLRCFYGAARRTGIDLEVRLRELRKTVTVLAIAMLGLATGSVQAKTADNQASFNKVDAGKLNQKMPAGKTNTPPVLNVHGEVLDQKIKDVLASNEYQWRFPREHKVVESKSWFGRMINDFQDWVGSVMKSIFRFIGEIIDSLFKRKLQTDDEKPSAGGSAWLASLAWIIYGLIGLIVALLAVLVYRTWKSSRIETPVIAEADAAPEINLESANIVASQLPENEWLRLAREKMEAGEMRLALRAFFLATLAHLGEKRLIAITKSKSNGDYVRELGWRARDRTALSANFTEQVRTFDSVWYGWHEVDAGTVSRFEQTHEQILSHAS